jgi:hypothetical protein
MAIRYDELIPRLKRLLPAPLQGRVARDVHFIERVRAIRASRFVWAVVLSRFGSGIPGFAEARHRYERLGGARLCPPPFQMPFKKPAVVGLFERAFEEAVQPWRTRSSRARHALARWFPDVVAWDSTLVQVSDHLRPVFKGARGAAASLKVALGISVFGRLPLVARLIAGHRHDMFSARRAPYLPGALRLKHFLTDRTFRQPQASNNSRTCGIGIREGMENTDRLDMGGADG